MRSLLTFSFTAFPFLPVFSSHIFRESFLGRWRRSKLLFYLWKEKQVQLWFPCPPPALSASIAHLLLMNDLALCWVLFWALSAPEERADVKLPICEPYKHGYATVCHWGTHWFSVRSLGLDSRKEAKPCLYLGFCWMTGMDLDASLNTVLLLEFLGKASTFSTLPRSQQCVFILQCSSVEKHLQRSSGAFEHTSWGQLLSPLAGPWQSKNLGLDWECSQGRCSLHRRCWRCMKSWRWRQNLLVCKIWLISRGREPYPARRGNLQCFPSALLNLYEM